MNILDIIYTIFIGPLKLLFEAIFNISNRIIENPGLSIVVLSFVLNILLLPLYNRADKIQEEENSIQKKLEPGVKHIKRVFKGDEQYMILQTYYRQNDYSPIYALRSLTSLLLQIPFFIAAASFLSNLKLLNNQSLFFINDLSEPDHLLFGLNILPIVMTMVNIVNCLIYTKGQPIKSKIQLYLMALVFLVLLYDAPSGLSFYYLLNNVFSLIKNIVLKIKNKIKVLSISFVIVGILSFIGSMFISHLTTRTRIVLISASLILLLVGIYLSIKKRIPNVDIKYIQNDTKLFYLESIFLCLLIGILIPSQTINASPEEFFDTSTFENPIVFIVNSFFLSFGTFVVWLNVYYSLMNNRIKKMMSIIFGSACFIFLFDYLFFGTNLGTMSNLLVYDNGLKFSFFENILNILLSIVVVIGVLYLLNKKGKFLKKLMIITSLCFVILSSINIVNTNSVIAEVRERQQQNYDARVMPELSLSKNGKNVVVLMLDRAIGSFFPYVLEERPEFKTQLSGFTYYPNTISFGGHTNFSTPSLFGGYEYTPEEINKRDNELLSDKHNEALLVMPVIFSENGYKTTVCDPPYAGYSEIPDLSIYDDYPKINTYITNDKFPTSITISDKLKRNLFCFSFMKSMPLVLQTTFYNSGFYFENDSTALDLSYLKELSVLQNLSNITKISNENGFVLLKNETTHSTHMTIVEKTDFGKKLGLDLNEDQKKIYYTNLTSIIEIGKWCEYLKNIGVYDNTKIIICSDHSFYLGLYKDMVLGEGQDDDLMLFNPLLLVKDFNSNEYSVDESFMTLADVPYLTTLNTIENPKNPFTGKEIKQIEKEGTEFHIIASEDYSISKNNGNTFLPAKWYSVHDDCRDINNWTVLGIK